MPSAPKKKLSKWNKHVQMIAKKYKDKGFAEIIALAKRSYKP